MSDAKLKVVIQRPDTWETCVICGVVFQPGWEICTLYEVSSDPFFLSDKVNDTFGDVCSGCIEAGPQKAAEKAQQQAKELREKAYYLDWLANSLPDVNAWPRKGELHERYLEHKRLAAQLHEMNRNRKEE